MNDGMHYCQAKSCKVEIPRVVLMCRSHWVLVPNPLKNAVNRTWRALNAALRSTVLTAHDKAQALRDYEATRAEAIHAVAVIEALESSSAPEA